MKKLLTAIAILLISGSAVIAQDKQRDTLRKGKQYRMEHMKALNLSAAQQAEMKTLHEKHRAEMQAHKNKNSDKEVMQRERRELMKAHRESVNAVLTPDQRATLQEQQKKMMAERKRSPKGDRMSKGARKDGSKMHQRRAGQQIPDLTDKQKEEMKKLRTESMKKISAVKNNTSLNENDRKEQLENIRKEQREQMMMILTPEQKAKMTENPRPRMKKKQ